MNEENNKDTPSFELEKHIFQTLEKAPNVSIEFENDPGNQGVLGNVVKEQRSPPIQMYSLMKKFIDDKYIDLYLKDKLEEHSCCFIDGTIGAADNSGDDQRVDISVRRAKILPLQFDDLLSHVVYSCGMEANRNLWRYNVTGVSQTELLKYEEGYFYKPHTDMAHFVNPDNSFSDFPTRKLTCLMLLNDDFEGGTFRIGQSQTNMVDVDFRKGDVLVFPSWTIHGVEPVTKGTRYCIVMWIEGPLLK